MHTIKISITVDSINIHVKCVFKVLTLFFFEHVLSLLLLLLFFFNIKLLFFVLLCFLNLLLNTCI